MKPAAAWNNALLLKASDSGLKPLHIYRMTPDPGQYMIKPDF